MLEMLTRVRLGDVAEHGHLAWALGKDVALPEKLLAYLALGAREGSTIKLDRELPPVEVDLVVEQRLRSAFTIAPPLSSRLPFHYHQVPWIIRHIIASSLARFQSFRPHYQSMYPAWPLDLSVDFLTDLSVGQQQKLPFCPVVLTHDLDSAEGLQNVVELFFPLEEAVGARSVNFVTPHKWRLDHNLLEEIVCRGHELGIHGFDHSNRTPFLSPDKMRLRVEAARPLVERYGIKGYRSPSLLRTAALYGCLKGLYTYDSSIPTSGGLFPTPENGCASARPFMVCEIQEFPLTLPRDGSLIFLGYSPQAILELWQNCAELIAKSGGIVLLLTHGERWFSGNRKMVEIYRRFLDWIIEKECFRFFTGAELLDLKTLQNNCWNIGD